LSQRVEQRFVVVVNITAALIRRIQNNMNLASSLDGLGTARNCSIIAALAAGLATSLANQMPSLQWPFAGSAPVTVYAWWKWQCQFHKALRGSPRHPERLPRGAIAGDRTTRFDKFQIKTMLPVQVDYPGLMSLK
jgi:hypothetical protein